MCGVQRKFNIFGGGTRSLGIRLAIDRGNDAEILALDRGDPFAPMKLSYLDLYWILAPAAPGEG
jgi:hypothetical protein